MKFIEIRRTLRSLCARAAENHLIEFEVRHYERELGLRPTPDAKRAGSTTADVLAYGIPVLGTIFLATATLNEAYQLMSVI